MCIRGLCSATQTCSLFSDSTPALLTRHELLQVSQWSAVRNLKACICCWCSVKGQTGHQTLCLPSWAPSLVLPQALTCALAALELQQCQGCHDAGATGVPQGAVFSS